MQKIRCSVCSCLYNAPEDNLCTLKDIQVCPCNSKNTGSPEDETCCASYKDINRH